MTDGEALLSAIRENPRDDLPRLVFADWLQEQGEVAYAEFIRLSCRIACESLTAVERKQLRSERFGLFQQMRADHPDTFRDMHVTVQNFDRGIGPDEISISANVFLQSAPHWWPYFSPTVLSLYDADTCPEALIAPELLRIRHLRLFNHRDESQYGWVRQPMQAFLLHQIAQSTALDNLRTLEVDAVRASVDGLWELARSRLMNQLEGLRIRLWTSIDRREIRVETEQGQGSKEYVVAIGHTIEELTAMDKEFP